MRIVCFIWKIADYVLRIDFVRSKYFDGDSLLEVDPHRKRRQQRSGR